MDKPKKPGTDWDPRRVPLHRRIRNRREELGMTAAQLADMVEVSPSCISLIEKGEKVPGEEVAARVALALRDEPGLYIAWTHATRHEDPERQLRELTPLHTLSSDPAMLERLASGEDLDEEDGVAAEPESDDAFDMMSLSPAVMRSALGEVDDAMVHEKRVGGDHDELSFSGMIQVPVLEDGADPEDDLTTPGCVIDVVRFDPRALPLETTGRLFAYRPGRRFLRRVEEMIKPGDLVILSSRMGRLAPDRIHAVRHEGEILLSRVLLKRNALLLLPPGGSARVEVIDIPAREALTGIIAGSVVTTLRNWGGRGTATSSR